MKKNLLCALLAMVLLLFTMAAIAEQESPRSMTVMVYMCGSNLETNYGSASADIQEMLDARFDTSRVHLLVMIGGSKNWSMGFDA